MNYIDRDGGPGVLERIGARANRIDVHYGADADEYLLVWIRVHGGGELESDRDVYMSDREMDIVELSQALGAATVCDYFEELLARVTARGEFPQVIDRVKNQVQAAHELLPEVLQHFHHSEEGV